MLQTSYTRAVAFDHNFNTDSSLIDIFITLAIYTVQLNTLKYNLNYCVFNHIR